MFARDIYCCTVKPALRDHSREMLKVVSYSRSLNKGVRSNDPDVCVGGGGRGRQTGHLKTLWKMKKILVNTIFSIVYSSFYPYREVIILATFLKNVICNCFQFGLVQNFVMW